MRTTACATPASSLRVEEWAQKNHVTATGVVVRPHLVSPRLPVQRPPDGQRPHQRLQVLGRPRGHHPVARVEVERRLDAAVLEEVDVGAGLARDQLARRRVHRAADVGGQHAVEARGRHVAEGHGDRAEHAQPVHLALELRGDRRDPLRARRLESDHLELLPALLGVEHLAVQRGAPVSHGDELLARSEVVDVCRTSTSSMVLPVATAMLSE